MERHATVAKLLIENNSSIDLANKSGATPLINVYRAGYIDVVKALLDAGADVDFLSPSEANVLHLVCENGHIDVVKLLLEPRAYIALDTGHAELVEYLTNVRDEKTTEGSYRGGHLGNAAITTEVTDW
ncbi:hypothetical protein PHMEG_00040095 [Phytophthora megakarya]|uniref:Uncharacterized protein n=1 Tax=Phytophthora megakarya TaxID=4795 RepID=A0A225UEC4_9STRA|nr:hypothetical protein PHMEG_00040095 [Phytophthora megakarya]